MSLVLITVYICYVLEFISAQAFGGHGHSHDTVTPISTDNGQAWQMTNGKEKTAAGTVTIVAPNVTPSAKVFGEFKEHQK